jgi:type I restriction enzyme S subunit
MAMQYKLIRLGDFCEKIGSGATPRGGKDVYFPSGIALIRSQNVYNDGFKKEGLAFIDEKQAKDLENVTVKPDDILLNITGDSVARVCQVKNDVLPARVNQHVAIIRPKSDELDPRYLRYYLVNESMQQYLLALASAGATRNALTKGMIESLELSIPPLPLQHYIAHILGTLDDKIEINRQTNETLEAMARTIFKSWFIDFDPVRAKAKGRQPEGMDAATAALFPSGFEEIGGREIPKGWGTGSLSDIIDLIGGGTPQTSVEEYWNGDIPWFSVVDTPQKGDIFVIDTEKHITQSGVEHSSTNILPVGTTIITARGTVGNLALVGTPMAMNQSCYGVRGKAGYSDYFIHFQLRRAIADLQQQTHGTVFETITRQTFDGVKIVISPDEIAQKFDQIVRGDLEKIRKNLLESRTLATLRDEMLPKLMSGEIPV